MPTTQHNLSEGLTALKGSVTSGLSGPDQFEQQLNRYELLGGAVENIREKDIISPLPDSEPKGSSDYAGSRIRTIRNRLYNLGYLKSDNKSHLLNQALKNAIARFQRDAATTINGFAVDHWVGEQTWTALQELVSFEEISNIPRWFKDGEACPALIRATQLRLYALGLIDDKPETLVKDLSPSLQHFGDICRILTLSDKAVSATICLPTISLLFDQDELIKRLAQCTAPKKKPERKIIQFFVMNMARVELWMLGFDIEPDGSQTDLSSMLNSNIELKIRSTMFKALKSYWAYHKGDSSKANIPARLFVKSSFPAFFEQLLKDTSADIEMDADEIYDCLDKNNISLDTVWQHVKSFGSRLWDGIKRIWGWFRNMVGKVASAVLSFIKNISRLAYQYILHSYEAVKAVIRGFCESTSYLFSSELKVSEHVRTIIRHDADFDFKILVHEGDKPSDVIASAEILKVRSRIFNMSSRILVVLINVLKRIATGFMGWAWLLMGLLRLYKDISRLVPELIALQKRIPI